MENKNPTLKEYFSEIIPDDSVFSNLLEVLSFQRRLTPGNHIDDFVIPYFFYMKNLPESTKTCNLLKAYMRITSQADKKLEELITLSDGDVNQCGVILRTDTEGIYTVYYIAIECKRGRTIHLNDSVDICVGVGF